MCFYSDGDYDWTASVYEYKSGPAPTACKCCECCADIPAGSWRYEIFMQEHECCQVCEDEWSDEFIDRAEMEKELSEGDADWAKAMLKSIAEHEHDYGESCLYIRCETCEKILLSIDEHEERAGCPKRARQPDLWSLWEELSHHSDTRIYLREAVAVFPELAANATVAEYLEQGAAP
jgi:hypothetical protein